MNTAARRVYLVDGRNTSTRAEIGPWDVFEGLTRVYRSRNIAASTLIERINRGPCHAKRLEQRDPDLQRPNKQCARPGACIR